MNISKCVLKLFFIAIACVCIQQPMYSMEDLVDILTTEIMMRPTNYPGSLKAWFKRWIIQNKKNRHISDMKKLGKKDCNYQQTKRVYSILKELGVEKPQQVPVKRLKAELLLKYSIFAKTSSTGIWISPSDFDTRMRLTEAHEAYHYANKHEQKYYLLNKLLLIHVLLPLIPSCNRYLSKILISSKSPLLCLTAVLAGYVGIIYDVIMPISNTLLRRWQERSACSFAINWVCDREYDIDVETKLNNDELFYLLSPELKIQLRSIHPSSFEYHRYRIQAYINWKKKQ